MSNEIRTELKVDLKKAKASIDNFSGQTKKQLGGLRLAALSFVGSFASSAAIGALNSIRSGMSSLVDVSRESIAAAQVQEDAINRLNTAMAVSGEFSEQAALDMQDYASSLQQVTTFGDEAILNQLAFAKSMGASNEQAKEVVTASTDMAAALGIDLESATRNVAKTLGGYAGELGEVVPALKNLTQEQLRAGEGVKLLADLFRGTASSQVDTFSGGMKQLSNTIGDTQEAFGELIIQSPVVITAIGGLNKFFISIQKSIRANEETLRRFITGGIIKFLEVVPLFADGLEFASTFVGRLKQGFELALFPVQALVGGIAKVLNMLGLVDDAFAEAAVLAAEERLTAIEAEQENIEQRKEIIGGLKEFLTEFTEGQIAEIQQVDETEKASVENLKAMSAQKQAVKKDELKGHAKFKADMKKINDRFRQADVQATQSSLATISTLMSQENEKLFRIGQAAAIANAIINTAQGITLALANIPPPASFVLAGLVGVAGAAQIATIGAQKPPSSAKDGIDFIPEDKVTFLASRGERVVGARLNQDLRDFLAAQNEGPDISNEQTVFNINITGQVGDSDETSLAVANAVTTAFENLNASRGNEVA